MLNKKTLYAIYLLHKASRYYDDKLIFSKRKKKSSLALMRLHGYLSDTGSIHINLNEATVLKFLDNLHELLLDLGIKKQAYKHFPLTIHQFNRGYRTWLQNITKPQ